MWQGLLLFYVFSESPSNEKEEETAIWDQQSFNAFKRRKKRNKISKYGPDNVSLFIWSEMFQCLCEIKCFFLPTKQFLIQPKVNFYFSRIPFFVTDWHWIF